MFLSKCSFLVLEVDIVLVSYSSAIFTKLGFDLIIFAAFYVGSLLTHLEKSRF
jgi:hypothetical protein